MYFQMLHATTGFQMWRRVIVYVRVKTTRVVGCVHDVWRLRRMDTRCEMIARWQMVYTYDLNWIISRLDGIGEMSWWRIFRKNGVAEGGHFWKESFCEGNERHVLEGKKVGTCNGSSFSHKRRRFSWILISVKGNRGGGLRVLSGFQKYLKILIIRTFSSILKILIRANKSFKRFRNPTKVVLVAYERTYFK